MARRRRPNKRTKNTRPREEYRDPINIPGMPTGYVPRHSKSQQPSRNVHQANVEDTRTVIHIGQTTTRNQGPRTYAILDVEYKLSGGALLVERVMRWGTREATWLRVRPDTEPSTSHGNIATLVDEAELTGLPIISQEIYLREALAGKGYRVENLSRRQHKPSSKYGPSARSKLKHTYGP